VRRILKFALHPEITQITTADAPRFLSVGLQGRNVPVVWVEASVGAAVITLVALVATGQEPPSDGEYIGTVQIPTPGGPFVVHAYGRPRP
jgi:hypothetical protein